MGEYLADWLEELPRARRAAAKPARLCRAAGGAEGRERSAERMNVRRVLTLDRRHFAAVRPRHCSGFEVLPLVQS
jgi:hypothetical protein